MTVLHQQINLYQPVFRRQEKVFSAQTLALIVAAVFVLLMIIVAHASWSLASAQGSAQVLEQQQVALKNRIQVLEVEQRTPDSEALDKEIAELEQDTRRRKDLLVQFDRLVINRQSGFASRFEALAKTGLRGLWLEGLTVSGGGNVEIRGVTLSDRLVPRYLQQLADLPELSETPFETVTMQRPVADEPEIQFVLRNFEDDG
jgi:Tfp pilus assembly protein PilN